MMIVLGPTVSIMFPLWLLGYFGFKMMKDIRLPPVLGAALWLSTFVLFYVIKFKTGPHGELYRPFEFTWKRLSDFFYHYQVSAFSS